MSDIDDGMEQWEPEPPPEGGYEVVRIYPYGDGAEEFVEDITSMARHDSDMAGISASGVGTGPGPGAIGHHRPALHRDLLSEGPQRQLIHQPPGGGLRPLLPVPQPAHQRGQGLT